MLHENSSIFSEYCIWCQVYNSWAPTEVKSHLFYFSLRRRFIYTLKEHSYGIAPSTKFTTHTHIEHALAWIFPYPSAHQFKCLRWIQPFTKVWTQRICEQCQSHCFVLKSFESKPNINLFSLNPNGENIFNAHEMDAGNIRRVSICLVQTMRLTLAGNQPQKEGICRNIIKI